MGRTDSVVSTDAAVGGCIDGVDLVGPDVHLATAAAAGARSGCTEKGRSSATVRHDVVAVARDIVEVEDDDAATGTATGVIAVVTTRAAHHQSGIIVVEVVLIRDGAFERYCGAKVVGARSAVCQISRRPSARAAETTGATAGPGCATAAACRVRGREVRSARASTAAIRTPASATSADPVHIGARHKDGTTAAVAGDGWIAAVTGGPNAGCHATRATRNERTALTRSSVIGIEGGVVGRTAAATTTENAAATASTGKDRVGEATCRIHGQDAVATVADRCRRRSRLGEARATCVDVPVHRQAGATEKDHATRRTVPRLRLYPCSVDGLCAGTTPRQDHELHCLSCGVAPDWRRGCRVEDLVGAEAVGDRARHLNHECAVTTVQAGRVRRGADNRCDLVAVDDPVGGLNRTG